MVAMMSRYAREANERRGTERDDSREPFGVPAVPGRAEQPWQTSGTPGVVMFDDDDDDEDEEEEFDDAGEDEDAAGDDDSDLDDDEDFLEDDEE